MNLFLIILIESINFHGTDPACEGKIQLYVIRNNGGLS